MEYKSIRIDELIIGDHYNLSLDDECYFIMEYTVGAGYRDSTYSLIHNFKKTPDRKENYYEWRHKGDAIRKIAAVFRAVYLPMIDLESSTLVPIPPSKNRLDPLYDDRMTQVLRLAFPGADIRELVTAIESLEPSHNSEVLGVGRPPLAVIQANLTIDESLLAGVRQRIILFDDVITVGTHYVACKNLIVESCPGASISGMFVSRRVIPPQNAADYFDLPDLTFL